MRLILAATAVFALASTAAAQEAFTPGPLLPDHGPNAVVPGMTPIPADAVFKVAFDVAADQRREGVNRGFQTVARYLNMHGRAGVPAERLRAALVVHGPAAWDLTQSGKDGAGNPNTDLIAALLESGVSVTLCGQSAAAYGIGKDDLLPGVDMALSAITAHALLQQEGYTVNPF